jgi:hypothetical protein
MSRKLLEATADIAYIAGVKGYYSGNSRADINNFIYWAEQFEKQNKKTDWDSESYIKAIEDFVESKFAEKEGIV